MSDHSVSPVDEEKKDHSVPQQTEQSVPQQTDSIDVANITDFDKLLDIVKLDASLIDNLSDEQITMLRTKLNPYGRTVEGSGKLTCLSITNLSEQYMKKFLMTSLIGFLYRKCDEYELDDGEPPTLMDDFPKFLAEYKDAKAKAVVAKKWLDDNEAFVSIGVTEEDSKTTKPVERTTTGRIEENNEPNVFADVGMKLDCVRAVARYEGFEKRLLVRQFIDSIFQFNPDHHVRSAYSDNPLDPERQAPDHVTQKDKLKKDVKVLTGKSGATMTLDVPTVPEVSGVSGVSGVPEVSKEPSRTDNVHVNHIPPLDTFHRWSYYIDTNYEEIRVAVQDLYCEKPDLEFAINPYDQFNDTESSNKFIQKHKNEVIADVLTLTNGKWNLCGSFKKNRERINFYNEKTAVIEEIFKQIELDKKLGADMMRKRVNRKKKINIAECGPDPEALINYKKEHPSHFENMGAENVSLEKKKNVAEDNVIFKVHEECPYDAVQVDVFDFRSGGSTVKKSEFFTQAEDPEQQKK
jgi:hypothetical protein